MPCGKLHILPIFLALWFIFTFIVMYIIAVCMNDVEPVYPYISDTGTKIPESCIFGQLLAVGSILLAALMYIRYKHTEEVELRYNEERLHGINKVALFTGWLAALGISIVGNFPEMQVFQVHLVGAIMAFGLGSLYQLLQWWITVIMNRHGGGNICVTWSRLLFGLVSFINFLLCFIFAAFANLDFHGSDITMWSKKDGGYMFHLASTLSEWICAFSTMFFLMTFSYDFRNIEMSEPVLTIKS